MWNQHQDGAESMLSITAITRCSYMQRTVCTSIPTFEPKNESHQPYGNS